jgi:hypothetical protein
MLKKAAERALRLKRNASRRQLRSFSLFLERRSRSGIWIFREFCSKIASSDFALFFTERKKTLIFGDQSSMPFFELNSPEI